MSAAVSFETVAYAALQAGLRLELCYDGYSRVVEVHTIGVLKDRNKARSVYQVRGGSNSGEPESWKMFLFDKIFCRAPNRRRIRSAAYRIRTQREPISGGSLSSVGCRNYFGGADYNGFRNRRTPNSLTNRRRTRVSCSFPSVGGSRVEPSPLDTKLQAFKPRPVIFAIH
jgi:hypothetical protein